MTATGVEIATAKVKGSDWCWILRVDDIGLYRWYLGGWIAMNIRGTTRKSAESALARFVQRTLRRELEITAA